MMQTVSFITLTYALTAKIYVTVPRGFGSVTDYSIICYIIIFVTFYIVICKILILIINN